MSGAFADSGKLSAKKNPRLRGRILIFGGAVGNLEATRALFAAAESLKIPPQNFIFTGDIAAYCADGQATADFLREKMHGGIIVRGNCETALAQNADECNCGFGDGSICAQLSEKWHYHSLKTINAETKKWMGELPPQAAFEFGGRIFAVVHASSESENRFIFESNSAAEKSRELDFLGGDAVVCGHSGLPFAEFIGGRFWLNAGAIGMPANDGTPRVWFLTLEESDGGISIRRCALKYDFSPQREKMIQAGLSEYADTLQTGIWPSDDILPSLEKSRQGIPIAEKKFFWAN